MDNVEIPDRSYGFEVLHRVANRIRLRCSLAETKSKLQQIAQRLSQEAGIRDIRFNEQTGSLVVKFESESQLEASFAKVGIEITGINAEISLKQAYSQAVSQLHHLVPAILGLVAVKGLSMYGWRALATYIATTGLTETVMDNLEWGGSQPSQQTKKHTSLSNVEPVKINYQIVHQIPGRIRIKVPAIKCDRTYQENLEKLAQEDHRIKSVRVNKTTTSILFNYYSDLVSEPSTLIDLIQKATMPQDKTQEIVTKKCAGEDRQNRGITTPLSKGGEKEGNSNNQSSNSKLLKHISPFNHNLSREEIEEQEMLEKVEGKKSIEEGSNSERVKANLIPYLEEEKEKDKQEENHREEKNRDDPSHSEQQKENIWTHFKSCTLATMLKFMASMPIQPS